MHFVRNEFNLYTNSLCLCKKKSNEFEFIFYNVEHAHPMFHWPFSFTFSRKNGRKRTVSERLHWSVGDGEQR